MKISTCCGAETDFTVGSPKDKDGECRYYWEYIIEEIVKPKLDKSKKK